MLVMAVKPIAATLALERRNLTAMAVSANNRPFCNTIARFSGLCNHSKFLAIISDTEAFALLPLAPVDYNQGKRSACDV